MSVDKSLKTSGKLRRHRNVLSRAERLVQLADEERWEEGDSVFGLPKVKSIRARRRGKAKEKPDEAAAAVEGEAAETPGEEQEGEAAGKSGA